jgi:hypothetical protein
MLSLMLSVIYAVTYAECHIKAPDAECPYAECHYAKCRGARSGMADICKRKKLLLECVFRSLH